MSRWKVAAVAVVTALAALAVAPAPASAEPGKPDRSFDLQAHRGGLGLRVESTLASFGDPEFPYVGTFAHTLTLAQVRTLDCGSQILPDRPGQLAVPSARMPLLSEVFDLAMRYDPGGRVKLNIETKVEARGAGGDRAAGAVRAGERGLPAPWAAQV